MGKTLLGRYINQGRLCPSTCQLIERAEFQELFNVTYENCHLDSTRLRLTACSAVSKRHGQSQPFFFLYSGSHYPDISDDAETKRNTRDLRDAERKLLDHVGRCSRVCFHPVGYLEHIGYLDSGIIGPCGVFGPHEHGQCPDGVTFSSACLTPLAVVSRLAGSLFSMMVTTGNIISG